MIHNINQPLIFDFGARFTHSSFGSQIVPLTASVFDQLLHIVSQVDSNPILANAQRPDARLCQDCLQQLF